MDHFSVECRETITKIFKKANQEEGDYNKEPMRPHGKKKHVCKWPEARENATVEVMSDWFREWRKTCYALPAYSRHSFENCPRKVIFVWLVFM